MDEGCFHAEKRAGLHEAEPARFMQRYFDYID